jgi:hypothetical protein
MAKASPLRPAHTSKYMKRPDQIRPPKPAGRRCTAWRNWLSIENLTLLVAAFALAFVSTSYLFSDAHFNREPVDKTEIKALVERIVAIESNGDTNARDKRSSATGGGQFLDDTWLEAVRRHRRDLIQGRSDKEILELRRDDKLAREVATRLVEQYAKILGKRGLPITPGSLYLAYFAGPAGAVALLSGAENADAASLMASADLTGRTTREKLVNANPFLKVLTVSDLKKWADSKMRGTRL